MNKKVISFILVIVCCFFIFIMFNMDTVESNNKSKGFIEIIFNIKYNVNNSDDIQKRIIVNKLNMPIRKCAHVFEFFILSLLLYNLLKYFCTKYMFVYVILLSYIFACLYEIHQLYIPGRTSQFMDIGIDMIGALIGVLVFYVYRLLVKDRRLSMNS